MARSYIAYVEELNLTLRLFKPNHAAYVHGLKTNHSNNSHLSKVIGAVLDQRAWIKGYKEHKAAGQ